MEDSFVALLYRLGYVVLSRRDPEFGLDVIARFYGELIDPKPPNVCKLLPPSFSPSGVMAFSLKRGDFANKDISELIEKVQKAKNSGKDVFSSLEGQVIVTNYTRGEKDIDNLLLEDVHCWDNRRLMLYSAKARAVQDLAHVGPVREISIEGVDKCSYIIETETSEKLKNFIPSKVVVFVDNHKNDFIVSSHHIETMLKCIYEKSLKPIAETTQLGVQVMLDVHVLGIADEELVRNAYHKYAVETASHPNIFFSAEPMIFQYGSAPWATLFSARAYETAK